MSIDELVAVNSLLIERETCLADLSHIETTISDILGQPYPFPDPPVELPSTKKGNRAKKPTKAKRKSESKKPPKVRRLKPDEAGYRLIVAEHGEQKTIDLLDFAPFQDLLANPLPHHRVLKIQTIDETLSATDTLFESA